MDPFQYSSSFVLHLAFLLLPLSLCLSFCQLSIDFPCIQPSQHSANRPLSYITRSSPSPCYFPLICLFSCLVPLLLFCRWSMKTYLRYNDYRISCSRNIRAIQLHFLSLSWLFNDTIDWHSVLRRSFDPFYYFLLKNVYERAVARIKMLTQFPISIHRFKDAYFAKICYNIR